MTTCLRSPALLAAVSWVLAIGLIVSVSLMATASTLLANLLERLPWMAWLELLLVVFVAFDMIWRGIYEIEPHLMM